MKKIALLFIALLLAPASFADERVYTLHTWCTTEPGTVQNSCVSLLAIVGSHSQWPYQPINRFNYAQTDYTGMSSGYTFDNLFGQVLSAFSSNWGGHIQSWTVYSLHKARVNRMMTYQPVGQNTGPVIAYSMDYAQNCQTTFW